MVPTGGLGKVELTLEKTGSVRGKNGDDGKTCFHMFDKDNNKHGVKSTRSLNVLQVRVIKNDLLTNRRATITIPTVRFIRIWRDDVKGLPNSHV